MRTSNFSLFRRRAFSLPLGFCHLVYDIIEVVMAWVHGWTKAGAQTCSLLGRGLLGTGGFLPCITSWQYFPRASSKRKLALIRVAWHQPFFASQQTGCRYGS